MRVPSVGCATSGAPSRAPRFHRAFSATRLKGCRERSCDVVVMDSGQGLAPGRAQCLRVAAINVLLLPILTFITPGRPDRPPPQDMKSNCSANGSSPAQLGWWEARAQATVPRVNADSFPGLAQCKGSRAGSNFQTLAGFPCPAPRAPP